MNVFKLKNILLEKLDRTNLVYNSDFNREDEVLRVERKDNQQGVDIALNKLLEKAKKDEKFIDEVIYYIEETLTRMGDKDDQNLDVKKMYPVVRSTSFPNETKEGTHLLVDEHTAETKIYYALDHGRSYELIDEPLLEKLEITKDDMHTIAFENLMHLDINTTKQTVQGNDFYFVNHNDGYDASRILNTTFLDSMYDKLDGEMMVGLPHQDVLIIVDVKNEVGYDILAQMMMQYFAEGLTPITSLSFSYRNKKLEPVFILGKAKNYNNKKSK